MGVVGSGRGRMDTFVTRRLSWVMSNSYLGGVCTSGRITCDWTVPVKESPRPCGGS